VSFAGSHWSAGRIGKPDTVRIPTFWDAKKRSGTECRHSPKTFTSLLPYLSS